MTGTHVAAGLAPVRPRRSLGVLALVAILAATACAERPAADACRWPAGDAGGWPVEDAGPFAFKRPPGLEDQTPGASAGSYVGLWAGGGRALAFDYGPHAPDPRGRAVGGEESWSCTAELGGRPAVVRVGVRSVEARPGQWQRHATAEAWWEAVGEDSARLLIMGWGPEADSSRVVRETLAAARSIRFRTVWTATDSLRQLHRFCSALRRQAERDDQYRSAWEEWSPRCPASAPPPAAYESVR